MADETPLSARDDRTLRDVLRYVGAGSDLIHGTSLDPIAAVSHGTESGLYIVYRPITRADEEQPWQAGFARVGSICAKGVLSWGVGAPQDKFFRAGRNWNLGWEGILCSVPASFVFTSLSGAKRKISDLNAEGDFLEQNDDKNKQRDEESTGCSQDLF